MALYKSAKNPKKEQAPKQQSIGTPYITSGLVGAGIGGGLGWGASHLLWKNPSKKQQLLMALLGVGGGAAAGALVAQNFASGLNTAADTAAGTAKDLVTGKFFADPTKDSAGSVASNTLTGIGSYVAGNRLADALWTRPRQLRDMLVKRYGEYLKHTKGAQPAVTQAVDSLLKPKLRPAPKTIQYVAKLISLNSQRNKYTAPILDSIDSLGDRISKDTKGLDWATANRNRVSNLLRQITGTQGRSAGSFVKSWFRLPNMSAGVLAALPSMALQRYLRGSQDYKGD